MSSSQQSANETAATGMIVVAFDDEVTAELCRDGVSTEGGPISSDA